MLKRFEWAIHKDLVWRVVHRGAEVCRTVPRLKLSAVNILRVQVLRLRFFLLVEHKLFTTSFRGFSFFSFLSQLTHNSTALCLPLYVCSVHLHMELVLPRRREEQLPIQIRGANGVQNLVEGRASSRKLSDKSNRLNTVLRHSN